MTHNTAITKPIEPKAAPAVGSGLHDVDEILQVFRRMTEEMSASSEEFERRVAVLNGEISALSAQRMEELREKERLADQLEGLLRILPTGVIVIDRSGRIQRANPAAEQMLVHDQLPELTGMVWSSVIQIAFRPQEHDGHEISLHNGRLVSLDTCALEGFGQLVVLNDMTATRTLQAEVSRHQRLAGMGRMVASMAHQIRTPLSAAMLYTENLRKPGITEPQRQRFAEKIQSRLEHLEQQVRDMLIFAKGDTKLVDRQLSGELLQALRESCAAALERSGSQLNVLNEAPDAQIICNRDTLISAFGNLVNNAIEAVGQNASIDLRVYVAENLITFDFHDHGPGVPQEVLRQLGEPFVTTKANGTGLGLPVVQAVMRAHHGNFSLFNVKGGTYARVCLPFQTLTEASS
ncbi:HAMP domain-containing histidine kinase [Salinispirillum sp. LH 10-3-1]|uniref:histidine kinase n=1 Tax=Salinispirillum sp. LH 10-3-1 TaxID=2952525 RepID=A0AB38YD88_9GAMM